MLALSQSLFSSFDIDRGSRLLLKCLSGMADLTSCTSILDLGCGCGILGLALKSRYPQAELTAVDRDALAVAFTRYNARQNGLESVSVVGGLGYDGPAGFDLSVSNLPAKAGAPVLRGLIGQALRALRPQGLLAFVIVAPLLELADHIVAEAGSRVLHRQSNRDYVVFVLTGGSLPEGDPLDPYIRGVYPFEHHGRKWRSVAAYNLPEFDTLAFETRLILDLLEQVRPGANILVWNPGQGHVARNLADSLEAGNDPVRLTLAGRDLLQLRISARNLMAGPISPEYRHVPVLEAVEGGYDLFVARADPVTDSMLTEARRLLKPGGQFVLAGGSTIIGRLLKQRPGFVLVRDKKSRGARAVLLTRT